MQAYWGKVEEIGGEDLKGLWGWDAQPEQVWSVLGKIRLEKNGSAPTFLIANQGGSSRGLNGQLFHEFAWD